MQKRRLIGRGRVHFFLFALLLVSLAGLAATGQDNGGTDAEAPQASAATPQYAVTRYESLGERFNAVLGGINGFIFGNLFFDVTFDAFKTPKVDDDGQPVYKKKPVYETLEGATTVQAIDADGELVVDKDGNPVTFEAPAGTKARKLTADGTFASTQGKQEMAGPSAPFLVVFLAAGAIFFTFWHGFINIRGFKHAVDIVRGRFTTEGDEGDITPFRALTSALSATVGLGNIAGVAIAVKTGGPGAIFWMMLLGLFGMTAKFHESTLAQMFRVKNPDGTVSGGPMFYLDRGFKHLSPALWPLGKLLAIIFALFCMFASLGGGNMFQSNQAFEAFHTQFIASPSLAEQERSKLPIDDLRGLLSEKQLKAARDVDKMDTETPLEQVRSDLTEDRVRAILRPSQIETLLPEADVKKDKEQREGVKERVSYGFGLLMSGLVAVVVIGGISRIGAATSRIVPAMCLIYVLGCLTVILFNLDQIPSHVALIFDEAFKWRNDAYDWSAARGGLIGVLIIGFQRAAFSSEAGLGSSAIAHSAAKTGEPIREGFVASLEPFIDTIVICFMTAMVVLITDAYIAPELVEETNGAAVTLYAFGQTRLQAWFPYVLTISIILFAFSTMISWCYYGERAWGYLFNLKTVIIFRLAFVACVFVGTVASLGPVIDFADAMLLTMALPNIFGGIILAGLVRKALKDYWRRYKAGEVHTVAETKKTDVGEGI